jgi:hypothetical protein
VSEIDEVDGAGVPLRQGEWLSVVGCATTDTRFRDPSTGIFYLDDGTGGIQVREAIGSITEVARGDRVWVGGVVQQSRGESYLGEATVELLPAAGGCPEPIDATTGAIAGAEPWEGRVVRLSGVTYSGSWPAGGAEGAVTLDDGTGAATLLVPPGVVVPPEASSLVDFELTALVTQHDVSSPYTSGYLLTLRDGADLFPDPQPLASPDGMLPPGLSFGSPRPNPFRDRLGLPVYGRARSSEPSVEIFDVTGRRVRSLAVPAGADEVEWDGRDGGGRTVGAGVYFLRLRADDGERVVRVTKVR